MDSLLEINYRFSVIEKVFVNYGGYKILEENFFTEMSRDNIIFSIFILTRAKKAIIVA